MSSLHLNYIVASRGGHNAIVRQPDGAIIGWIQRGPDDLLRAHPKGAPARTSGPGFATVSQAMGALLIELGLWREDH